MPKELSSLRSLTELNVGENKLAVLPDLNKLTRMTRLAAHWNNLVVAPDVRKLSALEVRWCGAGSGVAGEGGGRGSCLAAEC